MLRPMLPHHPIRVWRFERDMKMEAFARDVGISVGFLSQVETRMSRPSADLALRIAAYTGLTLDEILKLPEQAARSSPMPASLPRRRS